MSCTLQGSDLIWGQLEVEQIEVLLDPLRVTRLGDNGNSSVKTISEKDLGRCLVVPLCQSDNVFVFQGTGSRSPVTFTKQIEMKKRN